jgi:hypothetical protein
MTQDAKVVETLTREQVDAWRNWIKARHYPHAWKADTLCDMALLSLEYSERITKLEGALLELLAAGEAYAKAALTMDNARDNFTDSGPEMRAYEQAMLRVSAAEKAARSALPEEPK